MDFSDITILCIGDLMLDRFLYGDVDRISPEAPVPVLRLTRTTEMLGGAGNVANNIASLGGRAVLVGLVGEDGTGEALRRIVARHAGITAEFVATQARPTICKTRLIAGQQQMVRADEESQLPLQPAEQAALIAAIDRWLGQVRAVILSDYGKGLLSRPIIEHTIDAARDRGIPSFVDPKYPDFARYRGATCITPNLKELAAASGMKVADGPAVVAAARHVLADSGAEAVLATRSEKGMMLVEASGHTHSVPARAREVFDVSGAGDTVIATMALAHAAGRSLAQAMHIANAAAGVVVSKLGTATADIAEVQHELNAQDHGPDLARAPGVVPVVQARALVARWREQGQIVGLCCGDFPELRAADIAMLSAARKGCGRLLVALAAAGSQVTQSVEQRAIMLSALRQVDCVVSYGADAAGMIRDLRPDVLFHTAGLQAPCAAAMQDVGGRVVALLP